MHDQVYLPIGAFLLRRGRVLLRYIEQFAQCKTGISTSSMVAFAKNKSALIAKASGFELVELRFTFGTTICRR